MRHLDKKDFKSELKWYANKYAMKMDRTEYNEAKHWCKGVNYGESFANALFAEIKKITYTIKGRENTKVLCIDWDKTDF